ncbi:phage baseplate protein [Solilutibacter silvestris]|uniref:phage baseplate protein n=1 Tax=Solilutibacter silvestris TaxID=1645665 RepID=UPI003D357C54
MNGSLAPGLMLAASGHLQNVLLKQGRSIAGFIPQVVIEEEHTDELMITSHPVQKGANISDHAVKLPSSVIMRCGWSSSGTAIQGLASALAGQKSTFNPKDAYNTLLNLQSNAQPFDVITGKRKYKNMLIRRLSTVTDQESENVLIAEVELQQIIITSRTGEQTTAPQGLEPANAANPADVTAPTQTGAVQPTDVTASLGANDLAYLTGPN